MADLADIGQFRGTVRDPGPAETAIARAALVHEIGRGNSRTRSRRRRRALPALAVALVVVVATGLAIARSGAFDGPPAPPGPDAALQRLFPPLGIGHATTLATYGGRTFFGARTAAGGYCFSATSPLDPDAEGGHCVSAPKAAQLDAGAAVSTLTSSWTVGGYAPGAATVRLAGPGVDAIVPVASNGWWVGVADPHLTPSARPKTGDVTATGLSPDGTALATTTIFRILAVPSGVGIAYDPAP
jgi:hypothetical protein